MKPNIQDIDWNVMWKDAIEESNRKRKAGTPEFRDGLVDWFEELVRKSDRAGIIMKRIEVKPDYTVLDIGVRARLQFVTASDSLIMKNMA